VSYIRASLLANSSRTFSFSCSEFRPSVPTPRVVSCVRRSSDLRCAPLIRGHLSFSPVILSRVHVLFVRPPYIGHTCWPRRVVVFSFALWQRERWSSNVVWPTPADLPLCTSFLGQLVLLHRAILVSTSYQVVHPFFSFWLLLFCSYNRRVLRCVLFIVIHRRLRRAFVVLLLFCLVLADRVVIAHKLFLLTLVYKFDDL